MKQLPQVREYSYVDDMLPELIWLGLIHEAAGYKFGARLLELVVEATSHRDDPQRAYNYALQVSYAALSEETRSAILQRWEQEDMLDTIRDALAPLVLLYDGCALAFVGPPSNVYSNTSLVARIKDCVGNHLDKYETPGVALHGAMLLTRLIAGSIEFAEHIDLPDLNAVFEKPGSDAARRAASFMRANAGAEWGVLEVPNQWAKHFWNRNAELSPCEPLDLVDNDD